MRIKIYSGESDRGQLCESCRHATITRGCTPAQEIVRCAAQTMAPVVIGFKVTECSAYIDSRLPSFGQLLEQAWILRPRRDRRQAGFVRSSDLPEDEFDDVMAEMRDFDD